MAQVPRAKGGIWFLFVCRVWRIGSPPFGFLVRPPVSLVISRKAFVGEPNPVKPALGPNFFFALHCSLLHAQRQFGTGRC